MIIAGEKDNNDAELLTGVVFYDLGLLFFQNLVVLCNRTFMI